MLTTKKAPTKKAVTKAVEPNTETKPLPVFTAYQVEGFVKMVFDLSTNEEVEPNTDLAFIYVCNKDWNPEGKFAKQYIKRFSAIENELKTTDYYGDVVSQKLFDYIVNNYSIPKGSDGADVARIFELFLYCINNFDAIDSMDMEDSISKTKAKKILNSYGIRVPPLKKNLEVVEIGDDKAQIDYYSY